MPRPIALCLEDVASGRFVRCVAVAGNLPGLQLAVDGSVGWQQGAAACELFVSVDERLIALRRPGAPELIVERAGRRLSAPVGKPVVLIDQDLLAVAGRTLRLHVHGEADVAEPPQPLGVVARAAAAALGVALATAACPGSGSEGPPLPPRPPIEVRELPPAPPPPRPQVAPTQPDAAQPDRGQPIEVRESPPKPAARDPGERVPAPPPVKK